MILAVLYYVLIVVLALAIAYYLGIFTGAHYVPTSDKTTEKMLDVAELKSGDVLVDLGSGDGKIVIAAAARGFVSHGYEINPILVVWSKSRVRRAGLSARAFIHWKSFWRQDFSTFTVVTVYGIPHIMGLLEKKLERELPAGARVVCNSFPLPHWKGNRDRTVFWYTRPYG